MSQIVLNTLQWLISLIQDGIYRSCFTAAQSF